MEVGDHSELGTSDTLPRTPGQTSGLEQRVLTVASTEKKLEKQWDCPGFLFWLEGQVREFTGTSVKAGFEEKQSICRGGDRTSWRLGQKPWGDPTKRIAERGREPSARRKVKGKRKSLSCARLFVIPWTIQSMELSMARVLDWAAIPFSRGSSQPRDQTQVSHITGRFFTS